MKLAEAETGRFVTGPGCTIFTGRSGALRIAGIDPNTATPDIARALQRQIDQYGTPYHSSLVMARLPSIFNGYQALNAGMEASGLLDAQLKALINRRVASHNHCPF